MKEKTLPKREQNALAKQQAILEAAREEFLQHGFAAAKLDNIARSAKVGKGTLYLYFATKEAMFEAVILEAVRPFRERFMHLAEQGQSINVKDLQTILGENLPKLLLQNGRDQTLFLLIREGINFPHMVNFYYREVIKPILDIMATALQQAQKQGLLRDERILEHPQIIYMPIPFYLLWTNLFGENNPIDMAEIMNIHLKQIFKD